MANKKNAPKKNAPKKINLEVGELDNDFDLNKLHSQSVDRHAKLIDKKKRDVTEHLQENYEIDVKASYERSLALCGNDPEKIAHLESVLSSGNHKKDR